jgi:hypothetical protein
MLGGWLNVLDVAYDLNGEVLRFSIDFRQFDEDVSMTGPSTYSSLPSAPINLRLDSVS